MSFRSIIQDVKGEIGSISRKGFEVKLGGYGLRSRSHRAVVHDRAAAAAAAAAGGAVDALQQSCWAAIPPELLWDVLQRVEDSDPAWPDRRFVVSCAGVCRSWRKIIREIVKTPEISGKLTFPISLKQPGPRDSLLQCFIRRNRATQTYHLYLGLTRALADNGKFLLVACRSRHLTCTDFVISLNPNDISKGSPAYIGKLKWVSSWPPPQVHLRLPKKLTFPFIFGQIELPGNEVRRLRCDAPSRWRDGRKKPLHPAGLQPGRPQGARRELPRRPHRLRAQRPQLQGAEKDAMHDGRHTGVGDEGRRRRSDADGVPAGRRGLVPVDPLLPVQVLSRGELLLGANAGGGEGGGAADPGEQGPAVARAAPMLVPQLPRPGHRRFREELPAGGLVGERPGQREDRPPVREGGEGPLHHGLPVPPVGLPSLRHLPQQLRHQDCL